MNNPTLKEAVRLALKGETITSCLDDFEDTIWPSGFFQEDGKIFMTKKDEDILVSTSPFMVMARSRSKKSGEWSSLTTWLDPDSKRHCAIIPDSEVHKEVVHQSLKSKGLGIMPGHGKTFAELIMRSNSDERLNITSDMGWDDDSMMFVGAEEIISPDHVTEEEHTAYMPKNGGKISEMSSSGSLEEWQENVAKPCALIPLQVFAILAALASCLLRWVNLDVGGFSVHSLTSRGKTTLLQIFASVFGNGSDPNAGGDSCIRRWDSTANGLEGMAAKHNDIGLPLDEIGAKDPRDIKFVLYNLMSGRGKESMNNLRQLVATKKWRTIVFSSGEKSIREVLEGNGDEIKGGQLVRLADIPMDGMELPSSIDPAKHMQALKAATSKYYGTALPALVKQLVNLRDEDERPMGMSGLSEYLTGELEYWEEQLQIDGLTPEQARVNRRFALTAVAGALAVDFKIVPYTEEQVLHSVTFARDQWLQGMRESDPALTGIINVAQFIVDQSDQCVDYTDARSGKSLILIPGDRFNAACSGVDQKTVISKLSELSLLHRQESKRAKSTFTIDGKRARYYAVKPAIRDHYINS